MALTIPVAWRDAHHQGLDGVVEIRASDLAKPQGKDVSVQDLIALVNKKVREATTIQSVLHEVKQILLHGVRVSGNCPLEHIIPELMGSSPRLVATMRIRPNRPRGDVMTVFVKTLSGRTAAIECTPTDTVGYLKARVDDKEGIAPEDQRLTHAGKELQDSQALSFYNIQHAGTLYLCARIVGGFTDTMAPSRTFADVSDGSILTEVNFDPSAPEWRRCSKGLNIEGWCDNDSCRAYRQMIIDRKNFHLFNLSRDDNVRCPICRMKVKPSTCGLYDCCWRFEGVKAGDGMSICSQWKEARGYVYHRFDADETHGSTE